MTTSLKNSPKKLKTFFRQQNIGLECQKTNHISSILMNGFQFSGEQTRMKLNASKIKK